MRVVVLLLCLVLTPLAVHAGPSRSGHAAPVARYACPMHCEAARTYREPGACPVCGMALALVGGERYRVEVAPAENTIAAATPTTLVITIRDPTGAAVEHLEVVHEKLLHLLVTSADLSWFAHEHPERRPDGSFVLTLTFPAPGRYTLFHDFTPPRVGMQVVPVELTVDGTPPAPVPLVVDADRAKTVDGVTARLTPSSRLVAGTNLSLAVTLARDGAPVTDLEPFLGAMGHVIIVSADRRHFVHSHPTASSRGPTIRFQCRFPAAGTYKAWAQFQHAGRVVTVPFTLRVAER